MKVPPASNAIIRLCTRFWPFQSGKGKRLEMLRMKKILFAVVFIAMWQGKWIFPYDIHSNFCHLRTLRRTDARGT
ncbi:hypothetical protein ABFA07_020045 [Porites harrisoni]